MTPVASTINAHDHPPGSSALGLAGLVMARPLLTLPLADNRAGVRMGYEGLDTAVQMIIEDLGGIRHTLPD